MKIYSSISEFTGHTPLLELKNTEKKNASIARIIAKIEYYNPAGSVKDRVALEMINDMKEKGVLKDDTTIIEPTSGNTGIGLAAIGASMGIKTVIVMPDSMSPERIKLMRAYGAEVVLTPGAKGMNGAIAKAEELNREIPGSVIAGQFVNPANPSAHRKTTGPEIWEDTDGQVDIFVCGVGTGGTITGVGDYLKSKNPNVKIVGVEPEGSPVLTAGYWGVHKIQGIGAGFIPEILNRDIMDEVITVSDEDAYNMTRELPKNDGILAGISSGSAVWAAVSLSKRPENRGKNIVVLLPDTGARYLSIDLF